ncbi:LysR family transcriptional regulator [Thaumasiovibrio subtropicus]|uniref:LysR family transcriptional regulator n=1 Tax=Thaumasiovibrio subtropicus TaxID=1891207 RepID=UPI000B357C91|nr:LysR family transcriptional regulator [Thaumasiovibrio subtropicus]
MDMNLIRTFVAVYQQGSFTRAADYLGVSQPAVSMAVRRLENEIGTSLFVKEGRTIVPTNRAVALADKLQQGLAMIEDALVSSDEHAVYCIEGLSHLLGDDTDIQLRVPPVDQQQLFDELRRQQVDLVIDTTTSRESAFEIELVRSERICVVCREDHPRLANMPLTEAAFYQEGHIGYKARRDGRQFLDLFAKQSLAPRSERFEVSSQAAMALAAADSDYLGTVFETFAHKWASRLGLKVFALPLAYNRVPIHMIYHRRMEKEPHHQALRQRIKAAFS